jgi:glyoxylase-like metal-dependent hydrolase (beta-lactamase superfamily II)
MNIWVRIVVAATAIAVVASWTQTGAQSQVPADFNAFPVQGNVSMLIGPGGLNSTTPNITVQISEDAVVLVDSGRGDANDQVVAAIRRLSSKPVRFIINTQAGLEHTGGNEELAKSGRPYGGRAAGAGFLLADQSAGATIIAHENVLSTLGGARGGPAAPFGMLPTETYFTKEHELFNGEAIQLFHEPAAYTDGDSIVFFRRSDVISTGDIFSTQAYPRVNLQAGGTVPGVINALNHIIDLAIPRDKQEGGTYIIPGHGRVADEADVVEYRDMLVIIRDRVQDLLNKGRTAEQIKAAKVTFDYDRRYSKPEWTGEQLVESMLATMKAVPAPPAPRATRNAR